PMDVGRVLHVLPLRIEHIQTVPHLHPLTRLQEMVNNKLERGMYRRADRCSVGLPSGHLANHFETATLHAHERRVDPRLTEAILRTAVIQERHINWCAQTRP